MSCTLDESATIEKTIILDDFNEIELYFKGNVRIKQGEKSTITFIGYSLLLDNIKRPVINNKLIINLNNPFCKPSITQEIISVPPDIEDKWTFFFMFSYTNLNPSFDNGDPVEQIVLNFDNLYLYFKVGLDLRRVSTYFALIPISKFLIKEVMEP